MATQLVSVFDGTMVHVGNEVKRFDRGSAIPEYADADHVALLKERGMVVEGEPFAGLTHESSGPVAFDVEEDAKTSRRRAASGS